MWMRCPLLGVCKWLACGLVIVLVPAVVYHLCHNLPATFSQPRASHLRAPSTTRSPPAAAVIVNRQKRLPRRATRLHDKRRVMNRAWKERGGGRRGICPPYHCSLLKVQCAPLNSRLPAPHLAKIQLHSLNFDAQAGAHRKNRRSVGRSDESPNNSTSLTWLEGIL